MTREFIPSVCPHDCPSTCPLEVERIDSHTIGRVRGAADNPYSQGRICAKVARYAERTHHPERLRTPLRRTGSKGSGQFEPIAWDDALDLVAEAFLQAAKNHGNETVWPYLYAGTMGLVQRDGIERLRHAMGYSGMGRTICSTIADAGWRAGAGEVRGVDPREMAESDLIVLWGLNAAATQVHVMMHATRARTKRGTRIVVVDPYRNRTAKQADLHLALRPGTDGALACAVMHVLFRDGYADREYLARYTDAPDRLEAHLERRTPAWAAAITGLDEDEIVAFAHLYGSTQRSFLRLGYGFTRSRNGAVNMHAVSCLPAVTGAWQYRGGGALWSQSGLLPMNRSLIQGLDVRDPSIRVLDMSRIGAVLTGEADDLKGGPPVTAMLIQNTNPVVVAPESLKVAAGFARPDLFVCVHEQFMTETAAMADVVLPATTFVEHPDLYRAGGHTFFQVARSVIEPCAEARSNHEVICGLATRLGAAHPGFAMTAWEIIEATLADSDLPDGESLAEARWIDGTPDFEKAHFLDGFATADGRFHFAADWSSIGPAADGLPTLPDHLPVIEVADAAHPFRMVTAPAHHFLNTSFTETASSRRGEGRPRVLVHPEDCRDLGLAEDMPVRLGNRRGSVVVTARPFDGLQRGVVVVESIWPNADFADRVGINALVGAESVPPAGGAAFHDTAVWLEPV